MFHTFLGRPRRRPGTDAILAGLALLTIFANFFRRPTFRRFDPQAGNTQRLLMQYVIINKLILDQTFTRLCIFSTDQDGFVNTIITFTAVNLWNENVTTAPINQPDV